VRVLRIRSTRTLGLAIAASLLASCTRAESPDDQLWSLAAADVADAVTARAGWESVAVDAVGPAERTIAETLTLTLVARPGGRAVPCPVTATRDGIPDVTMFTALDRVSDQRATASIAFVCDYHDGERVRVNSQTFVVELSLGWLGWHVVERRETKQE
jgi:hypothetical protein